MMGKLLLSNARKLSDDQTREQTLTRARSLGDGSESVMSNTALLINS